MSEERVDVAKLNEALRWIVGRLDSIEQDVEDLQTVVTGQEKRIEANEEDIRDLIGRN